MMNAKTNNPKQDKCKYIIGHKAIECTSVGAVRQAKRTLHRMQRREAKRELASKAGDVEMYPEGGASAL